MALDDDTMCSVTVGGLYTSGFSVLPSNLDYGYDKLTDPYAFDPDAAMKLLDEAGIVDTNGDGARELDGKEVVLHYVTYPNRCLSDFAEAIQQQLSSIGIGVNLEIGSRLLNSGADVLIAGSYIFRQGEIGKQVKALKGLQIQK